MDTIALFGQAEKGQFHHAYLCQHLDQLAEYFGHPPAGTLGLPCAIQAILYKQDLLFFRVQEEGFSLADYLEGIRLLESQSTFFISALCLPGVGDTRIIQVATPFCREHHSILILREADLYDYLTAA